MTPLGTLTDVAWQIEHYVMMVLGAMFAIAIVWGAVYVSRSWMAGRLFEQREFRRYKTIKLNGKVVTITRIGVRDTDFLIINGGLGRPQIEFITIDNLKLASQEIRHLVRVYPDDNVPDKSEGA